MSVKFKAVEKGQPGVVGGGTKKFYAAATMTGEIDIEGLTSAIEKISTVSGADIRAVLYALVDVASDELADSNIVKIGDLGSFRMSVSSSGFDTAEEVNATAIKGNKILFIPGKRLKAMQKNVTYKKA